MKKIIAVAASLSFCAPLVLAADIGGVGQQNSPSPYQGVQNEAAGATTLDTISKNGPDLKSASAGAASAADAAKFVLLAQQTQALAG